MSKITTVKNKLGYFNKKIIVPGDKSLSIRWVLFASIGMGVSKAKNLLMSEDVIAAINAVRKLGIKVKVTKNETIIFGNGLNGYKYKKNIIINAQNSGLAIFSDIIIPFHIASTNEDDTFEPFGVHVGLAYEMTPLKFGHTLFNIGLEQDISDNRPSVGRCGCASRPLAAHP